MTDENAKTKKKGRAKLKTTINVPQRKGQIHMLLSDMRYGRSLSVDFFKRNAWVLLTIIVAVLSLIGIRYKNKTKMLEIQTLTAELERAESEKLQEKASYMTLIRETEMKRLVEKKGLGLQFQEQPPYELELSK